jgi:hypothetical protein
MRSSDRVGGCGPPTMRRPYDGGGSVARGERMRYLATGDPTLEKVSSGRASRWRRRKGQIALWIRPSERTNRSGSTGAARQTDAPILIITPSVPK